MAHQRKRVSGRSMYVVDLAAVTNGTRPADFGRRCKDAHLQSLWVRVGRGQKLDANFRREENAPVLAAIRAAGVEVWGWHVPFCQNLANADTEANNLVEWSRTYDLSGIVLDAERTPESPRFQGGLAEARSYCRLVSEALERDGRGCALSSHDQPQVHTNMPIATFLDCTFDNCPQVYYLASNVKTRLDKSISGYQALERPPRDFTDRYKPTGNITIRGDVALPSTDACHTAAKTFIELVKSHGFKGYSFWCLDEAPLDILGFLAGVPV